MKKELAEKMPPAEIAQLRERAVRLVNVPVREKDSAHLPSQERRLQQELEISRVELELQNEELRHARVELEAGLDRYTQLFDFAPIGYATLDGEGVIRNLNHVGASMFLENRARLVGRRFTSLVAPHDRALFTELLRSISETDTPATRELHLLWLGDDRTAVRLTAATLAEAVPTVLITFMNVTSEKQAEERLRLAADELRDANRRKDEFLAVLSHELRTPLSTIYTYGQIMSKGQLSSDQQQSAAAAIQRAARTQARLVDDLLDMSSIVSGKMSINLEKTDLAAVARTAIDGVAESAQQKGVEILVDFEPKLPLVSADPERLRQAISNLLDNAIKFTATAGQVRIGLHRRSDRASIQVQDTGSGIDASFLPRLFERFSQADQSMTRSTGGLGLGLSIAHSIVEAHRGTIRAKSAGRGKGSTFTISLLLDEAVAAMSLERPQVGKPAASIGSLRGVRILLVDDDAGAREIFTEVLLLADAEVQTAEGGEAAMRVLESFRPDVLVCDIAMPGERARTRAAGFEIHLIKPVDIETLLAAVSRLAPLTTSDASTMN
jgi:PAS domain S-box-containing protein